MSNFWNCNREIVIKHVVDMESLERKIKSIETRLLQLECSHPEVEFYRERNEYNWSIFHFYKKCKRCDKVLMSTNYEKEWLVEKAGDLEKKQNAIMNQINGM